MAPARALASALTLKLDRAMLDPGDKVAIRIGQMYALDEALSGKLTATVSLLKLKGEETVKDLKSFDSLDTDFIAHPFSADVVMPDVESGTTDCGSDQTGERRPPHEVRDGSHRTRSLEAVR